MFLLINCACVDYVQARYEVQKAHAKIRASAS